jgi:predicted esterase
LEDAPRKSAAYRAAFQAGITFHVAGDVEGARSSFEKCIELLPGDPVAPYNMACTLALHASPLEAVGWIDRARRAGYGSSLRRIEVMNTDPELAALRVIPEGRAALEAVVDQGQAFQEERERTFRLEPALRSDKSGLLVLLAGEGATRESMGAGPWPALASREGLILLAPPAPFGLGDLPQTGQSWIDDGRTILADPRPRSRELLAHLRAALAGTTLERGRVVLVGEGLGATIALDLALLAPGLFKKVLLVNGVPHRTSSDGRAAGAVALGVEVQLVWTERGPLPLVTAVSNESLASKVEIWLQEACGLSAKVDTLGKGVEFRQKVLNLLLQD